MSKWKYLAYPKSTKEFKLAEKISELEKKLNQLNTCLADLIEVDMELEAPLSQEKREALLRQREECF